MQNSSIVPSVALFPGGGGGGGGGGVLPIMACTWGLCPRGLLIPFSGLTGI